MSIFRKKVLAIGNECNHVNADLSDIDLTAATLDSRIKYLCASSHAYYAADGIIRFAEPNVWPLEYQDGVAVGRHEPEPQSTNTVKNSVKFADTTATGAMGRWGLNMTGGVRPETDTAPDGSGSLIVKLTAAGPASGQGVYAWTYDSSAATVKTFSGWCKTSSTTMRCYIEPTPSIASEYQVLQPSDVWQRFRVTRDVSGVPNYAGNVAFYSFNSTPADDSLITGWAWQLEDGAVVTSPIVTGNLATTRAASFVSLQNPGGLATSIRVHYSDGTTTDIGFPADGSDVQLPTAASDWGTRYITRIQYGRSL
ncbi:hypothetical protein ABHD31_09770 [Enterobacter cloacae]|uniref:phage head spike fiber domain-containing protein n=1 Tax=Enterobacter cloacae TaxID=550 RepID=UPI00325A9D69